MSAWLHIAEGPWFFIVFTLLVLGLSRQLILAIWEMTTALRRAGDRRLPYGQIARETLSWLIPIGRLHRNRPVYSLATFSLHIGILLVGLFLEPHVAIFAANLGLTWPAIPRPLLDTLTVLGIVALTYLTLYRFYVRQARALSRAADFGVLLLLLAIFASGFMAGRSWNPIPYDTLMLLHTLAGLLLVGMTPFTKIAHCVLFPLIRLGSEIAWHLTPAGGRDVAQTLYGASEEKS